MGKHTPGPWEAHETGEGLPWPVGVLTAVYKAGSERLKTDCICDLIAQGDGKYDPDVTNANARLIASAPDLLEESIQNGLFLLQLIDLGIELPSPWDIVLIERANRTSAAIAKAKGD